MKGEGKISMDEWAEMSEPARERANRARGALAALPNPDEELPSFDEITKRWGDISLAKRRAVLRRFLTAVVIEPASKRGRISEDQQQAVFPERIKLQWRVSRVSDDIEH